MNNSTFPIFSWLLLALLLCQSPARAAAPVATVVAARGEVQAIDPAGKSRKLAIRAPLFAEDTLRTDAHSRVQIMFTDNTLVSLGTATTMSIAEYRWQPGQKDGALKTRVKEGAFRVMGGALARTAPQNFKTETPTATIGIRGSMYAGVATADSLSVLFQGGKGIEISNAYGTVAITQPGYGTKADLGNPPLPPVKFTPGQVGELDKALNNNGGTEPEAPPAAGEPAAESDSAAPGPDEEKTAAAAPEGPDPAAEDQGTASGPQPEPPPEAGSSSAATDPAASIPTVTDLVTTVATDTSQTALNTEVGDTAASTTSPWQGNFRYFLRDIDLAQPDPTHFNSTFMNYKSGAVTGAVLNNGQISATLANGEVFGPYTIPGYDPAAASYLGYSSNSETTSYQDPTLGPVSLTSTTYTDLTGQFFYNILSGSLDSTPDYLVGRLLYAGIPSTTTPTAGIDLFSGELIHNNTTGTSYDANLEPTSLEVSYYNGRIIGRAGEMGPVSGDRGGAIFFGSLNSDGSATVKIVASGSPASGPPAVIGVVPIGPELTSSVGSATVNFYGDYNQGLGFTAAGGDYSLFGPGGTATSTWEATGAALRLPTSKIIADYPTSPITYTGFVVGVADDTATGAASRIFMSSKASDFTMIADPTAGVLSGSINADELTSGGAVTLTNLTVGGSSANSAYINSEDLVALMSGSNLALSNYGNLLYNNGPLGPQITSVANDYLTWGYWEMAYTDPVDNSQDHLFSSQSFFVAGQQTDPAYLSSLMNTPFSGTYTGKAFGVELDATGQNATQLTNGTTSLTVDFRAPSGINAVTGSINFDQASLSINSAAGALTSNGFSAYVFSVSGVTPASSAVNGAFYGPTADAVGGNFNAQMSTGETYLGIFGGSR